MMNRRDLWTQTTPRALITPHSHVTVWSTLTFSSPESLVSLEQPISYLIDTHGQSTPHVFLTQYHSPPSKSFPNIPGSVSGPGADRSPK